MSDRDDELLTDYPFDGLTNPPAGVGLSDWDEEDEPDYDGGMEM
jgi:hypothetical protein